MARRLADMKKHNSRSGALAAATMLAVTTGRQRLRPRMPKANSAAPGTNATHHSSQAVACRLLASLCRSSGSSGSGSTGSDAGSTE